MLPENWKPIGFGTWEREEWEVYRERLELAEDEATVHFFRQVVYDHFDHFNEHYPELLLEDYTISVEQLSAQQAYDLVRYFQNETMDRWGVQFDEFEKLDHPYSIYRYMSRHRTPPFPPIVIEATLLQNWDWRVYGRPLHLIEGTHRVSYLRRMLSRGIITPDTIHRFVVLRPSSRGAGVLSWARNE